MTNPKELKALDMRGPVPIMVRFYDPYDQALFDLDFLGWAASGVSVEPVVVYHGKSGMPHQVKVQEGAVDYTLVFHKFWYENSD